MPSNDGFTNNKNDDNFSDDGGEFSENTSLKNDNDELATDQLASNQQQRNINNGFMDNNTIDDNRTLLIDLSPSLLQLKELEVICQTQIEQTLIQYESKIAIAFNLQPQQRQHHQNHQNQFNDNRLASPSSTTSNGQILRGYQSPSSRIRNNQQSNNPSKLSNRNKLNPNNDITNANKFASSSSAAIYLFDLPIFCMQHYVTFTITTILFQNHIYNLVR